MKEKKMIKKIEDMKLVAIIDDKPSEAVLVTVNLSEIEGQIYKNQKGKIEIGSKGYKKLNQYAKISIVKPPTVIFNGKSKGNPYFIYKDGYLRGAIIRAMGIGYTVGGGIVISEQTVNYDVGIVFANELIKSVAKFPESGFMAADDKDTPEKITYFVGEDEREFLTKGKKWKYYQLDPWAGGIFVNPRSPNITQLISSHMQRLSSLSTRINTMVEKQVMRNHPALGMHYLTDYKYAADERGHKDLSGTVKLYMWKSSLTKDRIMEIREDIINGNTFGGVTIVSDHHDVVTVDEEETREEKVIIEDTSHDEKEVLLGKIKKAADKYLFLDTKKSFIDMNVNELQEIIKSVEGEE